MLETIKSLFALLILIALVKSWLWPAKHEVKDAEAVTTSPSTLAAAPTSKSDVASALQGGREWVRATPSSRREEVDRILGNIAARGCTIKFSADYYVKQLNDLYATPATYGLSIGEGLGLIATGAGENWDC